MKKKKAEFHALLEYHDPDIVVGTESWLNENIWISNGEYFPQSKGYTPFRRDRNSETQGDGGGVFILVMGSLLATKQRQLQKDCEILWIKLELEGYKSLYIASYYRP